MSATELKPGDKITAALASDVFSKADFRKHGFATPLQTVDGTLVKKHETQGRQSRSWVVSWSCPNGLVQSTTSTRALLAAVGKAKNNSQAVDSSSSEASDSNSDDSYHEQASSADEGDDEYERRESKKRGRATSSKASGGASSSSQPAATAPKKKPRSKKHVSSDSAPPIDINDPRYEEYPSDSSSDADGPHSDADVEEEVSTLTKEGYKWTQASVLEDCRDQSKLPKPTAIWTRIGSSVIGLVEAKAHHFASRTFLDYFLLVFPLFLISSIVRRTEAKLGASSSPKAREMEFDAGILLRFIGIVIMMTLCKLPARRDYWRKDDGTQRGFPAPDFKRRHGMSEFVFDTLISHVCWSAENLADKWWKVRDFVNGMNQRIVQVFEPGSVLCADESMSSNRTRRHANFHKDGIPQQAKIERKPEGVGIEIRTLACSESGVMVQYEIQESKVEMAKKKFFVEVGRLSGTASVLRLTQPFWNKSVVRTVVGDSAFASVTTAIQCLSRGLHFIGLVKTATRLFPMKYLKSLVLERGETATFVTKSHGEDKPQLIAHIWQDRTAKSFISTCSTSLLGAPHLRQRYRRNVVTGEDELYFKETPRSQLSGDYFEAAPAVDVHNHLRQGSMATERVLHTHFWHVRLIFSFISMLVVNAYRIYQLECEAVGAKSDDFYDFREKLALELVNNNVGKKQRRRSSEGMESKSQEDSKNETFCHLVSNSGLPQYAGKSTEDGFPRKCSKCGTKKSYFHCGKCSDDRNFFGLCGNSTGRNCFTEHLRDHLHQ